MQYYITTPIYYVNDKPHIGHAYTSVACDVLARFKRLDGYNVKFLTGTDEHGQKVEKSADVAGVTPQEFTDVVSETFRELTDLLNLSNDDFIRTTEDRHTHAAQALWKKLEAAGDIYLGGYAGWYSVRDEAFYDESELVDGLAPTGAPVEWVEEPSYFFRLSKYQQPLLDYYAKHPEAIAPNARRNEVLRFIEGGLHDLSISRTTFNWGVAVPGDDAHIMYVWLDALTNYLTALGWPDEQGDYAEFWPASLHMVGKDILRFHAVYWPAFLMSANLPLPKRVFAHGWWTNEGQKISKSLGNVIVPQQLVDVYGLDGMRYFLLREVPFGNDGNFSRAALVMRINSELVNTVGNLAQRTLSFIYKHCNGALPRGQKSSKQQARHAQLLCEVRDHMDNQAFHHALQAIINLAGDANEMIDREAPWGLKKIGTPEALDKMEEVLYALAEDIKCIAYLLQPFIPESSSKMLDQLAIAADARGFAYMEQPLIPGTPIDTPVGIFPRLPGAGLEE